MSELTGQAATQLANIEESTGRTRADFSAEIKAAGLEKHGQIISYLKENHGLTHGNANLLAKLVRDDLAGGPATDEELLKTQYAGAKAPLTPIYDEVSAIALGLGNDVDQVIQKTGVSFRRAKQFLLVQAPSSKRIQLGLNLPSTPQDDRVQETSGMCTHRVDITSPEDVDDSVASWITAAYEAAAG